MPGLVGSVFEDLRAAVAAVPGVVVVDVYGALGSAFVDDWLSDPLHLSALGHERYATEILRALGVVEVDGGGRANFEPGWALLDVAASPGP